MMRSKHSIRLITTSFYKRTFCRFCMLSRCCGVSSITQCDYFRHSSLLAALQSTASDREKQQDNLLNILSKTQSSLGVVMKKEQTKPSLNLILDNEPPAFKNLEEMLNVDALQSSIDGLRVLCNKLYWEKAQMLLAISNLCEALETVNKVTEGSMRDEYLMQMGAIKDIVRDRVCCIRDAFVYLRVVENDQILPILFEEAHFSHFKQFVYQFEILELDERFTMGHLTRLIGKFFTLVNKETSFVNLSPDMEKLIEKSCLNEKVSLLDFLASIQCRSPSVLACVCEKLMSSKGNDSQSPDISRAKLRAICFSLSELNYYHADLLALSSNSFVSDLKRDRSVTAQMAVSFLTLCKKLKFKNKSLIDAVATLMLPVMQRLLQESTTEMQKKLDLKCFAEFINSLASFNVELKSLQLVSGVVYPESEDPPEDLDLVNNIRECVSKCAPYITQISFYKSLCILGLLTDSLMKCIMPELRRILDSMKRSDSSSGIVQYERFCSHLILAHAVLNKLPCVIDSFYALKDSFEQMASMSDSGLSEPQRQVHLFFNRTAAHLPGCTFTPFCNVGLGYVTDALVLPKTVAKKAGFKMIVSVCPTMADSVNLFEELRGERVLQIEHLKQLGCYPFVVSAEHWSQLLDDEEKQEYLEAKFSIELSNFLKPHFKNFDFA